MPVELELGVNTFRDMVAFTVVLKSPGLVHQSRRS